MAPSTGHHDVKGIVLVILMAGLVLSGCKEKSDGASSTSGGNPITAPADYVGAVAKGKKTVEKTLDTAGLNQTIQLFYAQEGRYPKSLNELVGPNYLSQLPRPPAGMKFDYNPQTGQVKVVPQ